MVGDEVTSDIIKDYVEKQRTKEEKEGFNLKPIKTKLQSDGTIMPRSSATVGCAVATFD
jgi:hypothetical protein